MAIKDYLTMKGVKKAVFSGIAGVVLSGAVCAGSVGNANAGGLYEEVFKHALVDQVAREVVSGDLENKEEVFVPSVYSIGDVDGDGVEDWRYCKTVGECYAAKEFYKNPATGKYTTDKIPNVERKFGYWDANDVTRFVPEGVFVKN